MPQGWPTFALVSARTAGLVFVAPVWSMRMIPVSIRAAFAILLTMVMVPHVTRVQMPAEALGLPGMVAGEIVIGADRFEQFDHVQQGEPGGIAGKSVAAADAAHRLGQSAAHQGHHHLCQMMRRDAVFFPSNYGFQC